MTRLAGVVHVGAVCFLVCATFLDSDMEFEIGGKANTNIAASKEKRTSGRYRPVLALARLLVVTVPYFL